MFATIFLLTSHLIQEVTGQLCHGLKFSMSPLVALVDQVHIRSVILFKLKKKYANMGFVDRLNELESERSALITQRPTETGGCGGCRRWTRRFCILDENDVDLDEHNYSRGNSVLLSVWTKRCWLSVLAERVLIVIRLVTMPLSQNWEMECDSFTGLLIRQAQARTFNVAKLHCDLDRI